MTNLGPLTTTFTPPGDCSWISVNLLGSPTPTNTVFYDYKGIVWPDALRCFPSGYPYAYSDRLSGFYSPGICPSGWTAYPTSNFPDPAETTAYCCPSGYEAFGENIFSISFPCYTTHWRPSSTSVPALVISGSIDIVTRPYGDNTAGFITDFNFSIPATGWAIFGVQVRYRVGDFGHSTYSSTNLATTLTSATSSTTATTSPAGTNHDNSALTNGAKIGIWIGLPLFAIITGTIIVLIYIRKRGRQAWHLAPSNHHDEYEDYDEQNTHGGEYNAEIPGNKLGTDSGVKYGGKAELDGTGKFELDSTRPLAELDISIRHAEPDDTTTEMPLLYSQTVGIKRARAKRISSSQRAALRFRPALEYVELEDTSIEMSLLDSAFL